MGGLELAENHTFRGALAIFDHLQEMTKFQNCLWQNDLNRVKPPALKFKDVRATDAKEVGVGNPAEETFCHPNVPVIAKGRATVKRRI